MWQELIDRALEAKLKAIAPFSRFPVGAALMTDSGIIYEGCNIESSSYGLTMCAERVALFKALSSGERQFSAIAIASNADQFCPPCGACRQVLWDFTRGIPVILISKSGRSIQYNLADFFPHAFDEGFLSHE
ncbi:MAG: cytidine deaminase [Calditrichaeota bacterium]|nr:MAG: cytidine deaminase [Calditrichota bacterium]